MSEGVTPNLPNVVATRIVRGLRKRLGLTEDTCYAAAFAAWIPGGELDPIVQVIPGPAKAFGDGEGWQEGGELVRDHQFTVACWFTLKLDPHGLSEAALTSAGRGVLDFAERVRRVLTGADFGLSGQVRPMRYVAESATQVHEQDEGILSKTLTFAVPLASPFLDDGVLTEDDFPAEGA